MPPPEQRPQPQPKAPNPEVVAYLVKMGTDPIAAVQVAQKLAPPPTPALTSTGSRMGPRENPAPPKQAPQPAPMVLTPQQKIALHFMKSYAMPAQDALDHANTILGSPKDSPLYQRYMNSTETYGSPTAPVDPYYADQLTKASKK